MQHRHLTHEQYTLAAIDDIIARGKRRDWAELRQAALAPQCPWCAIPLKLEPIL